MRVLRRHNEAEEARAAEAEADAEAAEARADAADDAAADADDAASTTSGRRTFLPGWRRNAATETAADAETTTDTDARIDTDGDGVPDTDRSTGRRTIDFRRSRNRDTSDVDTVETAPVVDGDVRDDRDRTEPIETRPVTTQSEIHTELWSWADAVIAVVGAGLALVGLIALARAGIDRTWYRPVVHVLDADHTAALGAAEVAAGALLILAGVARSRAAGALLGLAMAVMGALAAIENDEVRTELAIEKWWAWVLAGVGLLVAVVALVPPRRSRVERVLETR
jgi:hypothetical protein